MQTHRTTVHEARPLVSHTRVVVSWPLCVSLQRPRFVYKVHTSGTSLMLHSFSSTLYLLLCRLFNRDYSRAIRLIDSCHNDTVLDTEQQWLLSQFAHLARDKHPDMHACRVKLGLALQFSPGIALPWDMDKERSAYAAKYQHVSVACRLPPQEEVGAKRKKFLHGEPFEDVIDDGSPGAERGTTAIFCSVLGGRGTRILQEWAAGVVPWSFTL